MAFVSILNFHTGKLGTAPAAWSAAQRINTTDGRNRN
jgi:hypothetical protein